MAWLVEPVPAQAPCFLHTAAAGHGTAWAFGIRPGGADRFDTMVFGRAADAWRRMDVPVIGRANGAVVVSPDELWVVGDGTSLHHVGGRWREVPLSLPVQLFGVVASGDDVWAAGVVAPDQRTRRGVVVRWDGSAWVEQALPDVAPTWGLRGLGGAAPDDLWAVGAAHADLESVGALHWTVALHWNGERWRSVSMPMPAGAPQLVDVVALAPDDVWAAGYWRRDGVAGRQPYAVHWDGVRWTVAELPGDAGQINELVVVKDLVYGVGYVPGGPYVAAWDGDAWHAVDGPPMNGALHGGTVLADGRLLVVGTSDNAAFAAVLRS